MVIYIVVLKWFKVTQTSNSESLWKAVLLFLNATNTDQNPSNPKGLNFTVISGLQVRNINCSSVVSTRFVLQFARSLYYWRTDGRAWDLRKKQNSIEQHVRIWLMLQISDTLFCSGATVLNCNCNLAPLNEAGPILQYNSPGNISFPSLYRVTQKHGNFWKTQQKLKKSKKKMYWQKLNHYNLPFKRQ